MKQQCYLAMIYLNWVLLVGGLIFFVFEHLYVLALAWVVLLPLAMWGYIRAFPSISQMMGYGPIQDESARMADHSQAAVRFYTALGCPFCPIVKQRLISLGEKMGSQLEEIDVTLKPGLLAAKAIWAVPVVELAAVGIYGVISYTVAQRTNEIGIRMALGVQRAGVIALILGEVSTLIGIGIAVGVGLALAGGTATGSLLFGLRAHDPLTLILAVVILAAIGLAASFVPSRRASRLDPMQALRYE